METLRKGSEKPPTWLRWLANDCVRSILDPADIPPIGCHFSHNDELDEWELTLFVSATEITGGAKDGCRTSTPIRVDIIHLQSLFDDPAAAVWQSAQVDTEDQLGDHVAMTGTVRGHRVWVRILGHPPDWSAAGRLIDAASGKIEDVW